MKNREKVIEGLKAFKRQECAKAGKLCAMCPKKYGNMCFAASVKKEICLN